MMAPVPGRCRLLSTLHAEHVPAIFFTIGNKVYANPAIVRAEIKYGFRVEDHTWDHQSFTGRVHPDQGAH